MAGPADRARTKSASTRALLEPYDPTGGKPHPKTSDKPVVIEIPRDEVRRTAARLIAAGYKPTQVARIMVDHLVPPETRKKPMEQKLSQARKKIRDWTRTEKFRDLVWECGLIELDLASGEILKGVAKKAKRGRVDAARLAFELTGRHNPKGEDRPTQVILHIEGVPRPTRAVEEPVDGEIVEEDD